MSDYCKEENIFINSTPVEDGKQGCVCETCIENFDISTWGEDEPTPPCEECEECENPTPPECECENECPDEEETDGFLENYDIVDI